MSSSGQSAAESLSKELYGFCRSDLLSEEGIREIIDRHGLTTNDDESYYDFFFMACKNERITEGIIQCLLEYFPDAASAVGHYGQAPLHTLCLNKNMTLGIIQLLIEAAPDSVRSLNDNGDMPLHALTCNKKVDNAVAIDILKLLIEKHPEAAGRADIDGFNPLHSACVSTSPEFCQVLIDADPFSVRCINNMFWMPLHSLCNSIEVDESNTIEILKLLIEIYPEAVRREDNRGNLPIHIAASMLRSFEFCQLLIEAAPDSVRHDNDVRDIPLHVLCANNEMDDAAAIQILKLMIEKYPDAVWCRDNDGNLPIHLACLSKSPAFCKALIDAAPDSVRRENTAGSTPLHSLCNNKHLDEASAMQMLKFLLMKYPEAVQCANNGALPIHLAAGTKSPAFCRLLIDKYPGSETIIDAKGRLPLHRACTKGSLETVEYLHGLSADTIHHAAANGHYPIHSTIDHMNYRENLAAAVAIVQFLLDCDPNQKLIQFQGRSLLHFACGEQYYSNSKIEAGIQMIKVIYNANPEAIEDHGIISNIHRIYHEQVRAFINGELSCARQAKDLRLMTTPDGNGRLPLHRALQNNVTLGSIKLLVKGNPSALRYSDNSDAKPLHIACQHHDSASVVSYLLELDTRTLRFVDIDNNTALHYACRGAKHDAISMLLEKYDAASVSKRNAHGKLPIHLLMESNEVSDRESVEYTGSVFRLLQANPEMVLSNSTIKPSDVEAIRHGKKKRFSLASSLLYSNLGGV